MIVVGIFGVINLLQVLVGRVLLRNGLVLDVNLNLNLILDKIEKKKSGYIFREKSFVVLKLICDYIEENYKKEQYIIQFV